LSAKANKMGRVEIFRRSDGNFGAGAQTIDTEKEPVGVMPDRLFPFE
jgi:hypothetical protein